MPSADDVANAVRAAQLAKQAREEQDARRAARLQSEADELAAEAQRRRQAENS